MEDDRKVHKPEIVGREKPSSDTTDVEHVNVTRVPGGRLFARSSFTSSGDPEQLKKSVKRLKARLWAWLIGFGLATVACFFVAYTTRSFLAQVVLILTGGLAGLVTGFLLMLMWAIRRLQLPE